MEVAYKSAHMWCWHFRWWLNPWHHNSDPPLLLCLRRQQRMTQVLVSLSPMQESWMDCLSPSFGMAQFLPLFFLLVSLSNFAFQTSKLKKKKRWWCTFDLVVKMLVSTPAFHVEVPQFDSQLWLPTDACLGVWFVGSLPCMWKLWLSSRLPYLAPGQSQLLGTFMWWTNEWEFTLFFCFPKREIWVLKKRKTQESVCWTLSSPQLIGGTAVIPGGHRRNTDSTLGMLSRGTWLRESTWALLSLGWGYSKQT